MLEDLSFTDWFIAYSFALPRLVTAFNLLPFFSKTALTTMPRNAVIASLSFMLVPMVAVQMPTEPLTTLEVIALLVKESVIGAFIGLSFASVFWIIEGVGNYIDNQRGASMAQSADPLTGSQSSPMAILFIQAFTAYALVSGAFLAMLGLVYSSYQVFPIFSYYPDLGPGFLDHTMRLLDYILGMVVLLSAPVILAMFVAEFGLALISRFAPQLNVFFLAMPIKSGLAVFILLFYIHLLFSQVAGEVDNYELVLEALR